MSKTIPLPDPDGRYLRRYASEGPEEAPLKQVIWCFWWIQNLTSNKVSPFFSQAAWGRRPRWWGRGWRLQRDNAQVVTFDGWMKLENIVETFCNYVKQKSLFRSRLKLSLEDREVPGSSPRSLSRDRWEENTCNFLTTSYCDRLIFTNCSKLLQCFLYCLFDRQFQPRWDPSISTSQRRGRCSAFGKVT